MTVQVMLKQNPTEGRPGVLVAIFEADDIGIIEDIITLDGRVLHTVEADLVAAVRGYFNRLRSSVVGRTVEQP